MDFCSRALDGKYNITTASKMCLFAIQIAEENTHLGGNGDFVGKRELRR